MADTRQPPSANAWEEFCRTTAALFPLARADELAVPLARLWVRLTNAACAVLVFRAAQNDRMVAACSNADGSASLLNLSDDALPSDASSFDYPDLVSKLAAEQSCAKSEATIVPLVSRFGTIGAVSLGRRESQPLEVEVIPELTRLTAGFIAQTSTGRASGEPNQQEWTARLEAAKIAALVEFAAGAGHEINNPLATISGRVQLLLRDEADPERRRVLTTIGGQAHRIRDMIGDLMLFADPPLPQLESALLDEVIDGVAELMSDAFEQSGCTLEIDAEENLAIWADHRQLEIVIDALLRNSLEASSPGGRIRIVANADRDKGPMARFAVIDSGTGIDETVRPHLFDPFFSGRQAGRGLGFGLSKCWRIVTNHGGRISVASVPGGQTSFEVFWPAAPRSP